MRALLLRMTLPPWFLVGTVSRLGRRRLRKAARFSTRQEQKKKQNKKRERERKEISVLNSGKALSVSVNEAQFGSSSTSGSMLEER